RWCIYKDKSYGYIMPAETTVPRSAVLYNEDMLEAVSGTCMKYSAVDIYLDKVVKNSQMLNKPWTIDWYFNQYRKTPYLEQLLKVGFYKITKSVMEDKYLPEFVNGKTILETLGVNKLQFNMLRAVGNPSVRDVQILQYAKTISQKDFDILRYMHDYGSIYEKYLDMRPYTTIYKVDKYIRKNKIEEFDYFDYIRWLRELDYDMRNEFNLYPKNFKKSHDEKSAEYIKFKNKKEAENLKRFNKFLKKLKEETADVDAMNLKIGGLFIRLPYKLSELKREGEALHHCVGTYMDRVGKGETLIFFIRKEEDPDKPFYTMEWKGKVVQCRGFKNCKMTPEVEAFVNVFQEKMLEYENKPKKRRKAG
ncbi:PcfJ domain-containing protein, partial [bacterium]|nr:PcfJ domain-containing protein [bacterium]